jgi:hypothetical protein
MLPLVNHFAYHALSSDVMIPDAEDVDRTNSPDEGVAGGLGRHVRDCIAQWSAASADTGGGGGSGGDKGDGDGEEEKGVGNGDGGGGGGEGKKKTTKKEWKPVFVLVDFYDHGPAVGAADRVNGIVPVGRVKEPSGGSRVWAGVGVLMVGLGVGLMGMGLV